jgi:hypothetical protein
MTEKDIANSIKKHSVKPIIGLAILILVLEASNTYFFDNDPISPILIILFSLNGCVYIFQKVLVDLLVTPKESKSTKE